MIRSSRWSLLLTLAVVSMPAAVSAQPRDARPSPVNARRPAPAHAKKSAEAQAWLSELQVLNAKLEALQARALQDPQLVAAQQSLGGSIKAAMNRIDPTLEQSLARGKQLQQQALAARQRGDQATLGRLAGEMQNIQHRFFSVQQQVVQEPTLAARLHTFQDRVQKKMTTLDPNAPKMIARFGQLQTMLAQAQGN
jgi:hypothetical protein